MIEMFYDAYSVAYYIVGNEMGSRTQMEFLEKLYDEEYAFLHPYYKQNKKEFVSDVLYCSDYLIDKDKLDLEFPVVERDFRATGRQFVRDNMMPDDANFDLFFMILRLRILYENDRGYKRMKLKTLLKGYGYKRRTEALTTHIRDCLMFYHIQPYLRGEEECDIRDIKLDDMVTFKVL